MKGFKIEITQCSKNRRILLLNDLPKKFPKINASIICFRTAHAIVYARNFFSKITESRYEPFAFWIRSASLLNVKSPGLQN